VAAFTLLPSFFFTLFALFAPFLIRSPLLAIRGEPGKKQQTKRGENNKSRQNGLSCQKINNNTKKQRYPPKETHPHKKREKAPHNERKQARTC